MRRLLVSALLTLALPVTADAQRLTPSGIQRPALQTPKPPTRIIPRLHTYMNWGTAIGAASGIAVGVATVPATQDRAGEVLIHAMVGAAVGNLAGLVAGLMERQPSDTLPAPLSNAVLRSPMPMVAARVESWSRYVGLGGRIGASVGFLGALAFSDDMRALSVPFGALVGFTAGMAVGGIVGAVDDSR